MAKYGWIFGPGTCASTGALNALGFGQNARVRRVVCGTPIPSCACPVRAARWGYDATPVLQSFGREVALDVAHLWRPPPIVLRYLKTGDGSIREAAQNAARDAASAAADGPAADAAWAAAATAAPDIAPDVPSYGAVWGAAEAAASAEATARDTIMGPTRATTVAAVEKRQSTLLARLLTRGRHLYGQRRLP